MFGKDAGKTPGQPKIAARHRTRVNRVNRVTAASRHYRAVTRPSAGRNHRGASVII